jgi:hypothetical protein
MKKSIQYKGKATDDGRWVFGYLTMMPLTQRLYDGKTDIPIDPETLCSDTGWQLKDGTRVYEGDILWCMAKPYHGPQWSYCGEVIWNQAECQYQLRLPAIPIDESNKMMEMDHGLPITWGGWAVIKHKGNIHDDTWYKPFYIDPLMVYRHYTEQQQASGQAASDSQANQAGDTPPPKKP